jgi:hypothetical protein
MRARLQRKRVIARALAATRVIHRYRRERTLPPFAAHATAVGWTARAQTCSDMPVGPSRAVPLLRVFIDFRQ